MLRLFIFYRSWEILCILHFFTMHQSFNKTMKSTDVKIERCCRACRVQLITRNQNLWGTDTAVWVESSQVISFTSKPITRKSFWGGSSESKCHFEIKEEGEIFRYEWSQWESCVVKFQASKCYHTRLMVNDMTFTIIEITLWS